MKKILIVVAVLFALIVADVIYLSQKDQPDSKDDAKPPDSTAIPPASSPEWTQVKAPKAPSERLAQSQAERTAYCMKAVDRFVQNGYDTRQEILQELAKLLSPRHVFNYMSCKAVEEADSKWCRPLDALFSNEERGLNSDVCMGRFEVLSPIKFGFLPEEPKSEEELERIFAANEPKLRASLVKDALILQEGSASGCEKADNLTLEPCRILLTKDFDYDAAIKKAKRDLENSPDSEESRNHLDELYLLRAFRERNIGHLNQRKHEDRFLMVIPLMEKPYCDAAFRQIADLACQGF